MTEELQKEGNIPEETEAGDQEQRQTGQNQQFAGR